MPPKKILLSARDPGAAGNLAVVAQWILDDQDFELILCAAPPASKIFARHGLQVHHAITGNLNTKDLLDNAEAVLTAVRPDILLVGLSGPDCGIDEALLHLAHEKISRLALQDFWGDVNSGFGRPADLYLVQDEMAARITTERWSLKSAVVGLPKYIPYRQLSPQKLKNKIRNTFTIPADAQVIGFCGQPLWQQPGYYQTIKTFLDSLSSFPQIHFLFRPHPKESREEINRFSRMVLDSGRKFQMDSGNSTEAFLCGCDITVSAFSNCTQDLAYLNRLPDTPGGVPLYLMVDPKLRSLYKKWTGLNSLPLVDLGVALTADCPEQLTKRIAQALRPETRIRVLANARQRLPDPSAGCKTLLDILHQTGKL